MLENHLGGPRIRTKLIISYIAVVLFAVILVSLMVYLTVQEAIIQHARQQDQYLTEQLAVNLAAQLKSMEELQFNQFCYSQLGDLLASNPRTLVDTANRERKIRDSLSRLCYAKGVIEGAAVVDLEGHVYAIDLDSDFDVASELERVDRDVVDAYRGKALWIVSENGRLLMNRQLISINTTRPVGHITIAINPSYITQVYGSASSGVPGDIILYDSDSRLLPSSESGLAATAQAWLNLDESSRQDIFWNDGKEYIITSTFLPRNDFSVLRILPVAELGIYTRTLFIMMMGGTLASIFIAVIAARVVSSMVTGNIDTLVAGIRSFARGELTVPVRIKSRDEIGYLAEEFNHMASDIQRLIRDTHQVEKNKRIAETNALRFEYSALEARINPHFIYNTLESVNSLAKLHGEDAISEIVCLLGTLLKDNIGSTTDFIPFRRELTNIQTYMRIQTLTYRDKFDMHVEADEDTMDALVPKFILQPLVENAVYHGILARVGRGNITLRAKQSHGDLLITLSDDGIGIGEEDLARLLDYSVDAKNEDGSRAKIGVRAVDKRLKILFGEDYGLRIQSRLGQGTIIHLRMPVSRPTEGETRECSM